MSWPIANPTYTAGMPTFQARRSFSSSELLALQRQKIEKSLNTVPSINLQDSSELTARTRKGASIIQSVSAPTRGTSGNMVKFNDCSVVQAMVSGSAYRASATRYQPRVNYTSPGCSTILNDAIRFPRAVKCDHPATPSKHIVYPYDPVFEQGLRKNDNKVVMTHQPTTSACGVPL